MISYGLNFWSWISLQKSKTSCGQLFGVYYHIFLIFPRREYLRSITDTSSYWLHTIDGREYNSTCKIHTGQQWSEEKLSFLQGNLKFLIYPSYLGRSHLPASNQTLTFSQYQWNYGSITKGDPGQILQPAPNGITATHALKIHFRS